MWRGASSCRARPDRTAPSVIRWTRRATMLEDACTRASSGQAHSSAGPKPGHWPADPYAASYAPHPGRHAASHATDGFRLGVSSPGVVCHQTLGDATLQHAAIGSRVGISSNKWHAMPSGQRWPLNPRSIQGACAHPRKN
jgi:hypothetical protein